MDAGDVGLKQQFQLLQEQQQRKLLERRKRKEKKNERNEKEDKNSKPNSATFEVNDDLNLKLAEHSSKGYGYVSEELVDHLNDQIRQMKDENGRLFKLLSEKDFEIRQLKKKKDEQASNTIDLPVTSETAATKIVELSKKVRELTAEKESEKTRCKQFQKKCHDLQIQLQTQPGLTDNRSMMGSVISLQSAVTDTNKEEDSVDVKAIQDRLKQSESRLSDFRNQARQLRQELKVAHKVLSQEIGENVNISSLLNETSQWRGRAQQIIGLQQKVDELKARYEGPPAGDTMGSDKVSTARRRQEERYREELRRAEKERKESLEVSMNKLRTFEEENSQIKNKLDASKTRNKVLSNELKGLKAQVQTLLRKSQNDDEFIEALMKQQKQLKEMMETTSSKQSEHHQQQQQQLQQMNMKVQQDNNIVEQLKLIAAQKESQVKMLEMELEHLRNAHAHHSHTMPQAWTDKTSQGPEASTLSVMAETTTPAMEEQSVIGGVNGLTFRQREASQLSSARSSARSLSRLSNRATPTPAIGGDPTQTNNNNAVSQQETDLLRYQVQELTMMSKAVEVERDKMTELVQVLQARLSEEVDRHSKTQQELQGQKRTGIELEKLLGRKNMEAIKMKGVETKGMMESTREENDDSDDEISGFTKAELTTRLEIQKDEINSLKVALQRSLKAKEEDLKVYSKTLDETKQVFLQALRQMKDRQTSS